MPDSKTLTRAGLIGVLYAAGAVSDHGIARWVVVVAIYVFALTYCATWGLTGKIVASEIQPAKTRASANAVAQGLGFVSCDTLGLIHRDADDFG